MSDLISRRDATMEARPEYLNPNQKGHEEYNKAWNDGVKAYWNGLKELPSESEWIPCSERLPDERQDVYVTVLWDDYGDYITAYGMRMKFGWNLHSNAEGDLIKGYTVVAWMPLPEPYSIESDGIK